jgi:hypothetical protein
VSPNAEVAIDPTVDVWELPLDDFGPPENPVPAYSPPPPPAAFGEPLGDEFADGDAFVGANGNGVYEAAPVVRVAWA